MKSIPHFSFLVDCTFLGSLSSYRFIFYCVSYSLASFLISVSSSLNKMECDGEKKTGVSSPDDNTREISVARLQLGFLKYSLFNNQSYKRIPLCYGRNSRLDKRIKFVRRIMKIIKKYEDESGFVPRRGEYTEAFCETLSDFEGSDDEDDDFISEEEPSKETVKFSTVKPDFYINGDYPYLDADIENVRSKLREIKHVKVKKESLKNAKTSEKLRRDGNVQYMRKEFEKALITYTKSLATAPINSVSHAYAHANRAVILAELGLHKESIAENQRVLKIKAYPKKLHYKIYSRLGKSCIALKEEEKAVKCYNISETLLKTTSELSENAQLKFMENTIEKDKSWLMTDEEKDLEDLTKNRKIGDVYKFKSVPSLKKFNPEIPQLVNGVNLEYDSQFGRKLVAKREIKIGEYVIIEEPYVVHLLEDKYYTHCFHCYKRSTTLLPCQQCKTAMFCSNECYKESLYYHEKECCLKVSYFNISNTNGVNNLLFLRGIRCITLPTIDVLRKYFAKKKKFSVNNLTEKDINEIKRTAGFNHEKKYISSYPGTFENAYFDCNEEKASIEFLSPIYGNIAAHVIHALGLDNFEYLDYLIGYLIKHFRSAEYSGQVAISEYIEDKRDIKGICPGVYPTFGLMNHSCNANVILHFYGKKLVAYAYKPIDIGDQLTLANGVPFTLYNHQQRQNHLKQILRINNCTCIACEEKWPLYKDLPKSPHQDLDPSIKNNRELLSGYTVLLNSTKNSTDSPFDQFGFFIINQNNLKAAIDYINLLKKHKKTLNQLFVSLTQSIRFFNCSEGNRIEHEFGTEKDSFWPDENGKKKEEGPILNMEEVAKPIYGVKKESPEKSITPDCDQKVPIPPLLDDFDCPD